MEKNTIILISNCFQAVAEVLKAAAKTASPSPEMEVKKVESAPKKVVPEPEEGQKTPPSGVKKRSGRGRPKKSESKPKEDEDTEVEIEAPKTKTASGVDDFGDDFDEFNDGPQDEDYENATLDDIKNFLISKRDNDFGGDKKKMMEFYRSTTKLDSVAAAKGQEPKIMKLLCS
jgi:hypothetical protein